MQASPDIDVKSKREVHVFYQGCIYLVLRYVKDPEQWGVHKYRDFKTNKKPLQMTESYEDGVRWITENCGLAA